MHDRGIVHLDLKPRNILISRGITAVISDFGCAKVVGAVQTRTRLAAGLEGSLNTGLTVAYASPELVLKESSFACANNFPA